MKVLISGSSGLIGTELVRQLEARGDQAIRLVRRKAGGPNEIEWQPELGTLDPNSLDGVDAVVNLAGASIGKLPWTKAYKAEIIQSRLGATATLVKAINQRIAQGKTAPSVLISGSASGFYGDTGEHNVTEDSPSGNGFLADLASKWEAEASKVDGQVRLVLMRTSIVLSRKLGALGRLLALVKLGIGGRLGSGKQWWAWISLPDEVCAILHLIDTQSAFGSFNLVAPEPATCGQMVDGLGRALHRPTILPVPAFALRLILGEGADEMLLGNQKLSANKLISSGYEFNHPTLASACNWVVEKA